MRSFAFVFTSIAVASGPLVGCGGGEATAPIQRSASTLEPTSSQSISAVVATTVTVRVIARDGGGAPVEGVNVSFSILAGGGSVSPTSAPTTAAGTASASWKLGSAVGVNDLRAAVTGVQPVSFTATTEAGPASVIAKFSGDNQPGQAATPLAQPLTVRVTDLHENPVPSVTVTFTVTGGGGTIEGSPAVTDTEGMASAGPWILGTQGPQQTVRASIGSASVQFVATADVGEAPGQCPATVITTDSPVTGSLATGDCEIAGELVDTYQFATTQPAVSISISSTSFAPKVTVSRSGQLTASSDDVGPAIINCDGGCHTPSTTPPGSPVRLLAGPGSHLLTASSKDVNGAGAYTLAVAAASSSVTNCETVFLERGITTVQQLEPTDCKVSYSETVAYYSDDMKMYLGAGSQLRVRMSSSAFVPWLDLFGPTGALAGSCVNPGTAECTFSIQATGYYVISPSSFTERGTGEYTLSID